MINQLLIIDIITRETQKPRRKQDWKERSMSALAKKTQEELLDLAVSEGII